MQAAPSPPVFDYFIHLRYYDVDRKRITIPFEIPKDKRSRNMAHAEYIANAIRKDIQEYRIECFDNFGIEVRIHPMESAFEIYEDKGRWVGFNQYVFDSFGAEPKQMSVTVDQEWNVKIRYLGKWRPISAYLKNVKRHNAWDESMSKNDSMHRQWRQQADWWKENGKVFPLMGLPAEIREMIYEHHFGPFIEPYPTHSSRKLTNLAKYAAKLRAPNTRLLRTNHLVSAEASNILRIRTPYLIEHYGVWKALTMKVEQRNLVRHLVLAFSHDELMRLFSNDHIRRNRKAKTEEIGFGYPALALRSMKLSSLTLVIGPPSLVTERGNFDGACQRALVEMIMEAAWPIIRGHPLELHGYVKESQKKVYHARDILERKRVQAWQKKRAARALPEGSLAEYDEEIKRIQEWQRRRAAWHLPEGSLAEYDKELDEEVGGVALDESNPDTASEQIQVPEYNLVCYCNPPCTEETWTP